ncbi:MAG: cob(I)yrinic acid a,c-diamide adenosyltransferase [Chloroflexi bacterium]|nr:cob(I)yrinic acid a,c-diamide adenosyltransferase [Chloroflexota bacterium]MCL5074789.1 cob(I)yrinic acid a,c-diamide adenosyltransferase [Chloroflexota bacterium]
MASSSSSAKRNELRQGTNLGLVHVYTGDGKGKTTAALGLALRAVGQGLRVHIVQFLKGVAYGEVKSLARLPNISLVQFGSAEWVHPERITVKDRRLALGGLEHAREAIHSGYYDLVILDEINIAVAWNLLPLEAVLDLIRARPKGVELVLTGRQAPPEVIELADLVTEMKEIKHPFGRGVMARRGIEF